MAVGAVDLAGVFFVLFPGVAGTAAAFILQYVRVCEGVVAVRAGELMGCIPVSRALIGRNRWRVPVSGVYGAHSISAVVALGAVVILAAFPARNRRVCTSDIKVASLAVSSLIVESAVSG